MCRSEERRQACWFVQWVNSTRVRWPTTAHRRQVPAVTGSYVSVAVSIGGFKRVGARGHVPELGPNKFQDRSCGTSRMQKNLFATGAPPRAPLDELTAFPQTPYLAGKGLAAISPKTSPPTVGLLGLGLWPFGSRRWHKIGSLPPPQHDGLDALMADSWMSSPFTSPAIRST